MTINVLIVDDDIAVNQSLLNFLEDFDYRAQSCLSAEEALDLAATQHFDVAIIDLRLPKMDGDQLILELHKLSPQLNFLIHTGSTEFSLTEELSAIGLSYEHILSKPLPDMMVLIEKIKHFMK